MHCHQEHRPQGELQHARGGPQCRTSGDRSAVEACGRDRVATGATTSLPWPNAKVPDVVAEGAITTIASACDAALGRLVVCNARESTSSSGAKGERWIEVAMSNEPWLRIEAATLADQTMPWIMLSADADPQRGPVDKVSAHHTAPRRPVPSMRNPSALGRLRSFAMTEVDAVTWMLQQMPYSAQPADSPTARCRLGELLILLETVRRWLHGGDEREEKTDVQMFVLPPDGPSITLDVRLSWTVDDLKEMLRTRTGIPHTLQCITAGGRRMHHGALLEYGLRHGSTLCLGMPLYGGGREFRRPHRQKPPRVYGSAWAPGDAQQPPGLADYTAAPKPARQRVDLDEQSDDGGRSIFVGGLPRHWSTNDLTLLATRFGRILHAQVFYDQEGRQRGAGKITFVTSVHCQAAKDSIDDMRIGGKTLRARDWCGSSRREAESARDLELEAVLQRTQTAASDLMKLQQDAAAIPSMQDACAYTDSLVTSVKMHPGDLWGKLTFIAESYRAVVQRYVGHSQQLATGISQALEKLRTTASDVERVQAARSAARTAADELRRSREAEQQARDDKVREQVHSGQLKMSLRQEYRGEIESLRQTVASLQHELDMSRKQVQRQVEEEDALVNMFERSLRRPGSPTSPASSCSSSSRPCLENATHIPKGHAEDVPRSLAGGEKTPVGHMQLAWPHVQTASAATNLLVVRSVLRLGASQNFSQNFHAEGKAMKGNG